MSVPTRGEEYTKLMEYLVKAQECCAMLAHLHRTESSSIDDTLAHGWLAISENLKKMQRIVTQMAMNKLQ